VKGKQKPLPGPDDNSLASATGNVGTGFPPLSSPLSPPSDSAAPESSSKLIPPELAGQEVNDVRQLIQVCPSVVSGRQ
jgi:hypothetical protein